MLPLAGMKSLSTFISALTQRASFEARYRSEVERVFPQASLPRLVTESDLAGLPDLLATYLRRVGVVGKPQVRNLRARWGAEIRSSRASKFMRGTAEQYNFFAPPARMFRMRATRSGIPFEALHLYVGDTASMQVRLASLIDLVDARGPEMNQGETVTVFNDMCLLAPASLLEAEVRWRSLNSQTLEGTFTNAGNTIRAQLSFDARGDLVNFISEDRYESADGKTYRRLPWSTPIQAHAEFAGVRVFSRGQALWHEQGGSFVYARFELEDLEYNLPAYRVP